MTDRSVTVRLRAEIGDFKKAMADAAKATQDVADGMEKTGKTADTGLTKSRDAVNQLSNKVGLLGVALTGAAVVAVSKFADFDAAMSGVAATGDDARQSIDALREAAIDAGAKTVYSASEAAGAIENLEKAGVSAKDILGGGLKGALNLAAAGAISVEDAAEDTATALTIFGLKGTQASHVADLLAAGAGKAQGGVSDMAMALKQTGLVAANTGLSIEETTGGLAAFASAGLIGSDAGTSFKTMLQRLTPQSDQAKQAIHDLGISAYDGQGNFVGLAKYAGLLQQGMKDLTPEARNAAMATIFGSDAVRAATVLYNQGEAGVRKWIAAVDDQGYAAKTAATRMDNLKGDLENLSGAIDTDLIQAGSGANDVLRSLTQSATGVVQAIGEIPKPALEATTLLAGAGGLALLGIAAMGKLAVGINDARLALQGLELSAKAATLAAGGIGIAIGLATFGVAKWAQEQAKAKQRVEDITESLDQQTGALTENTRATIFKNLQDDGIIDKAKTLGLKLDTVTEAALGNAAAVSELAKKQSGYQAILVQAQKDGTYYNESLDGTKDKLALISQVIGGASGQSDALTESQKKVQDQLAAGVGVTEESTAATVAATGAVADQTDALGDLVKAMGDAAGIVLSVRDAQAGLEQSYDDAAEAIKKSTEAGVAQKDMLDITTQAGRDNQSALDDVAKAGYDLITSLEKQGATQTTLQQTMQGTRDNFINLATQMGLTQDDAGKLADQLNLIPANIHTTATLDATGAYQQLAALNTALDRAAGKHVTIPYQANLMPTIQGRAAGGPVAGTKGASSTSLAAWLLLRDVTFDEPAVLDPVAVR